MRSEMPEAKSVVIRGKMKSALTKVWLAARARRAAKAKAEQDFGVFAEIGMVDGLERYLDSHVFEAEAQIESPNNIELVTLALERLSPACMRVAVTGVPQTVTVPDARTADVFRAAIAASAKMRLSDRLVKIVVAKH